MAHETLSEHFVRAERLFDGRILTLERWQVTLCDGRPATREVVRHVGAAAIVPVDQAQNVTLVWQSRVAIDQMTLELPAGKKDSKDEDPLACARRELREETGLSAGKWELLTNLATCPAYSDERIALYLATDLTMGETHPDEDEFLTVETMPLSTAVQKCLNGEIIDGKTIAGVLAAYTLLNERE